MQTVTPFLWFDDDLEEAFTFYASLFPATTIRSMNRGPDGRAFTAELDLGGQALLGLNGGPYHRPTEAFSLAVTCDDQAEVDRLWAALTTDGGEEGRCGWCKDRFGWSWQIIPAGFSELMTDPDAGVRQRVMDTMMTMQKLDISELRAAAASTGEDGGPEGGTTPA